MMRLSITLVALGFCCVCLLLVIGCESGSSASALSADELAMAAWKTHANYMRAYTAGETTVSDEVPEIYWADGLRTLHPVKVYIHRVNIVAVQKISNGVEEGKYIYIPISSYLPRDGDDGFTFFHPDGPVCDFTRRADN